MERKEAAKQIRKELKDQFSFTKFSVRCSRGSAINISWTDFPTVAAVKEITNKHESVSRCEATGEILSGGNMFIFENQTRSEELTNKVNNLINETYGNPEEVFNDRSLYFSVFNRIESELYTEFLQSQVNESKMRVEELKKLKEEKELEKYHLELQEKGMAFTQSNPEIKEENNYKAIVSVDRETNQVGEFEKILTAKEINDQLWMNEVLEITEVIEPKENTMTAEQEESLNTRLNKSNVKPLRLFMNKNNNLVLEAINTNLEEQKPFYFVIFQNGREEGRGYDFPLENETLLKEYETQSTPAIQNDTQEAEAAEQVTYQLNEEKHGVELKFNYKPSKELRDQLKINSFRWSKYKKVWYAKQSNETIQFAKDLVNELNSTVHSNEDNQTDTSQSEQQKESIFSYPEININDLDTYKVSQSLIDREHDSSWIFRRNKRDLNKELRDLFESYHNTIIELLEQTDNQSIVYHLKNSLQRFKKRYYDNYIKYLTHKANNPSWAVTGRSGRNMNKYNKQMDRQDKLMSELIEGTKWIDRKIDRAKRDIRKDKENQVKQKVNNTDISIQFKAHKKEFDYMGIRENKRVYSYGDFFICKLWGMFRVFYKGKELDTTLKTTDTLKDAQRYVSMLVSEMDQESQKEAI